MNKPTLPPGPHMRFFIKRERAPSGKTNAWSGYCLLLHPTEGKWEAHPETLNNSDEVGSLQWVESIWRPIQDARACIEVEFADADAAFTPFPNITYDRYLIHMRGQGIKPIGD